MKKGKNKNDLIIICLNGNLPDRNFFLKQNQEFKNIKIIAADGAANTLYKSGIIPNIIIGDLDSLDTNIFSTDILNNIKIIKDLNQNKTDFEKVIEFLINSHSKKIKIQKNIIILGINGGYIDHIVNNLNIMIKIPFNYSFYDPPIWGYIIKKGEIAEFNIPIKSKISIFGFVKTFVKTSGLKWNLNHWLNFPGMNSALNRSDSQNVIIEVKSGGNILIMIYDSYINDNGI
ncbi:thiamine diphosphokinase [Lyticum sinuosum]|uniref:Thiamine diphosphokinase n=1 Tax=Lyticum sinuosum TaxID=1332059 RepID=A0AAE4VL34_9RICK|nr:thiamine diphosphokinase [Lyticum sinuosum]MDZ5761354.1 thiamine pyrophosphokinase [Lyticum sinuosum]